MTCERLRTLLIWYTGGMQKITPFFWFEAGAEDAAQFYLSIFKDSSLIATSYVTGADMAEATGLAQSKVLTLVIELLGMQFTLLNGGKVSGYAFSPATSFTINCDTQEEIDHYWSKLGEGGKPNQCGWLTDKFGVTWQVTPSVMGALMTDPDKEKVARVSAAMMKMAKLDIAALEAAAKS